MQQSGTALVPIDITVVTILWTLRLATKAKYTATVIAASLLQPSEHTLLDTLLPNHLLIYLSDGTQ